MSQEIDDLLEIDSNSEHPEISFKNLNLHIIIRTIIPFLIIGIGFFLASSESGGGYNGLGILIITGGIIIAYLVILLIEMLVYFSNNYKPKGFANLIVFGIILFIILFLLIIFLGLE